MVEGEVVLNWMVIVFSFFSHSPMLMDSSFTFIICITQRPTVHIITPPTPLCHCLRHNVLIPAVLAQPQLPPLHPAHLLTLLPLLFLPSSPSPPPPLRVPAKVGVGQGRGLGHITMPATAGWTVTGRVSSRVLQTRVTPTHGGRRT